MGKGDRKTRRGKIFRGTYGKTRPRRPKPETGRDASKKARSGSKSGESR